MLCSGKQSMASVSFSFPFPSLPLPSGDARREPNPIRHISTWPRRSTEAAELCFGADKGSARCQEAEEGVGSQCLLKGISCC